jgi:Zn-dependent peptidase ImmA (M78 family)
MAFELDAEFRDYAEKLALRRRAELGLTEHDRLEPRDLAEDLDVQVFELTGFPGLRPEHQAELQAPETRIVSAVTVVRDGRALIVVNDTHTPERQTNSLAHELAHLLLGHEPGNALDALGNRIWPARDEAEADWLAACLLVPAAALRAALRTHGTQQACARHFGVSDELMRWRCNVNGLRHAA